jgi:glutamyl-tRNA synthetase
MKVRVRFAPSPTGFLHIGGARTALFNWLYARHTGGVFVLRIEDTDAARNTQPAIEVILDGLRWLGLDWDEGPIHSDVTSPSKGECGPYFQSQRQANYQRRIDALLSRDLAYEKDGAIKFRMTRDPVLIPDLVAGEVTRHLTDREELDPDFVIVRSDGQPVFHLVNVVDDLDMGITHVIRGEDHLSNTAKHIALFRAFEVKPPHYAHIPLILNPDGSKMSKRDQGASLSTYMEEGYAPEALLNYLVLLGWSPKDNREIMPLEEIVERFDFPEINRSNARFDMDKFTWMNYEYIRNMSPDRFHELVVHALDNAGLDTGNYPLDYVKSAVDTCRDKLKKFTDAPSYIGFYFLKSVTLSAEVLATDFGKENRELIHSLRQTLLSQEPFTAEAIQARYKSLAVDLGVKVGKLVHPTRQACTGSKVGPSLYHLMEILGREEVVSRLDAAMQAAD